LNWLSPAHAFIAACALLMSMRIWRIDRTSSLNNKLALSCFLSGFYELGNSMLVALSNPSYFTLCLIATSAIYLCIGPTIILALLDFAEIKGREYWLLGAPCAIMAAIQIVLVLSGHWVIVGFHPSVWGNINSLTSDKLPIAINSASSLLAAALGLGILVYAWLNSSSRRYRAIAVSIFAIAAFLNLWGLFSTEVIWMRWGLPDPTGLSVGIGLVGYALLIDRYRHLYERQPDIDLSASPLADPSCAVLFVDTHGCIKLASESAQNLLQGKREGEPLAKALSGWPSLSEHWSAMSADLKPQEDLPGTIDGGNFALSILPHRNPFDEFDGAVVRIIPEGSLDELGTRFGLSAREREVAQLICKGLDTKEISEALFISIATVKSHLHNVYTKTNTSGRADLIRAILSK
jgi:DNA-binding CsgD family transcriptional regulator